LPGALAAAADQVGDFAKRLAVVADLKLAFHIGGERREGD
jgi:hypothetical protein